MQTELPPSTERSDFEYDQTNDRYVFHYDRGGSATLTATIVHALATITEVDVSQGEFSLYDSIDPDALERLFRSKADGSERTGGHVAFTALECDVYVYADGEILIYPPEAATAPARPRPR
ncbi:HalOD1 output domain-containing protein [Natrononativus amylolyticus]|uniref:HalOD1 output domain-containing protein n=1 Tax=Natrononativus amylolyticus TaxID=2963434 RepID=UPI0020CEFE42|nr:HalOD1 output domain-containing protein [Natrononativus amylolyticus]